jgi:hypothetical protein
MASNRINVTLNDGQNEQVKAALASIEQALPFLIDLSSDERSNMLKFGEKNRSFVVKALAVAEQNPEILPRGFALEEFQNDVHLVESLFALRLAIQTLADKIDDTYFAAGSEGYAAALLVYQYAKTHNLATGALEGAIDDLGRRFVRNGRSTNHKGTAVPA